MPGKNGNKYNLLDDLETIKLALALSKRHLSNVGSVFVNDAFKRVRAFVLAKSVDKLRSRKSKQIRRLNADNPRTAHGQMRRGAGHV